MGATTTSQASELRCDGLYQTEKLVNSDGADYWTYLRFYEDGTVLTVSADATFTPREVFYWLKKEDTETDFSHGSYEFTGDRLAFSATCSNGAVDYEGTIEDDVLALDIYSRINDQYGHDEFHFVPVLD